MKNASTRYSYIEVKKYIDRLSDDKNLLTVQLESLTKKIKRLKKILKDHDEYNQKWMVTVPIDLILEDRDKDNGKSPKINWKKNIMLFFNKYDQPMTSDMLYSKFLLNLQNVPSDRTYVLGNISAALHYLAFKDCRLVRVKRNGDKSYIYGLPDYFEMSGIMKDQYFEKFKIEADGQHMNRQFLRRSQN